MPPKFDLFITSPRLSADNPPKNPKYHPNDPVTIAFTADPAPTRGSRRVWAWLLNGTSLYTFPPAVVTFLDFSPATATATSMPIIPTMTTPGPCLLIVTGEWFSDNNFTTLVGTKSDQVVLDVAMPGMSPMPPFIHRGGQEVVLGEFVFRVRQ